MKKPFINVDSKDFMRDMKSIAGDAYPVAVARSFKKIASIAAEDVRDETRLNFKLHSDYIPKGIRSTPSTKTQVKAAARSVEKYHDIEAAVYVRPGSGKRSLAFMTDHEDGANRRSAKGKDVAVPAKDLGNYSSKTSRGARRKNWKPAQLLAYYNRVGGNTKGNKLRRKGRGSIKKAYLKKSKTGVIQIVRRKNKKSRSLEFLYSFLESVKIAPRWDFEQTVDKSVKNNYVRVSSRYLNAMRPKK